ncbi:MAG: hypothetical protein V2G48_05280 [bacterium JZ-2024 1]
MNKMATGVFLLLIWLGTGCARMEKNYPLVIIGDIPIFMEDLRRDIAFQFFLEQYVRQTILERAALSAQISQPSADVIDKALQESIKQNFGSEEKYERWLKERGLSREDHIRLIRREALVDAFLRKNLEPSREEARNAFEKAPDFWKSLLSQQTRLPREKITPDNPNVLALIQQVLYYQNRNDPQKIESILEREMKRYPVNWNPKSK